MPELALQHNGGNIQQRFLHKPLESVYLSVGTQPYQQPRSNAPWAEECQRERKDGERGSGRGRKRGSLEGFDMYSRTYMATPPANAALLEHICVWDGWGPAYERRGVNSSLSLVPWDPFCCLQISVEFRLSGRRAEVKRMPWLRLRRTRGDNRPPAKTEACQHAPTMEAYKTILTFLWQHGQETSHLLWTTWAKKKYTGSNNVRVIQWAVWASLLVLAEPALRRYPPATEHNAASAADCCLLSIHLRPKHSHF